ncbi:hypothetical protein C8J57DRAFT_1532912 [Mycena rebaudengoi]|nr:hypothetical protein C8J57DRAFT_1532912 [Mycena rebaudengoi]
MESLYPDSPTITVLPDPLSKECDEYQAPMNHLIIYKRVGDRFRIVKSDSTTRRGGLYHMPGDFHMVPELELAGTVGTLVQGLPMGGWAILRVDKDGLAPGVKLPHHSAEILATGLGRGFKVPEYSGEIFIYVRFGLLSFEMTEDPSQARPLPQSSLTPSSSLPHSLRLVGCTVRTEIAPRESDLERESRGMTKTEEEFIQRVALNAGKRYEGHFVQVVGDHVEKTHAGIAVDDRDVLNPDGTTSIMLIVKLGDNRLVRIPLQHALHTRSGMQLEEAVDLGVTRGIGVNHGVGELITLPAWQTTPAHTPSSSDVTWGMPPASPAPLYAPAELPAPPPAPPAPHVDVERGSWLAHRELFGKRLDVKVVGVTIAFQKGNYQKVRSKQQKAEGQRGYLVIPPNDELDPSNFNKRFVKPQLEKLLEYTLPPPCVKPINPSGRELTLAATRVVILGPDVDGGSSRHFGAYAMIVPEGRPSPSAQTAKVRVQGGETAVFPLESLCRSTNEKTFGEPMAQATIF